MAPTLASLTLLLLGLLAEASVSSQEELTQVPAAPKSATEVQTPEVTFPMFRGNSEGLWASMGRRLEHGEKGSGEGGETNPPKLPVKNKIVLVVLEAIGLTAMLGIDRCYMGQTCLGIVKGMTLGGLGIWSFIDYITVFINCLSKSRHLDDALGWHATFEKGSVQPAFWIAVIVVIINCLSLCGKARSGPNGPNDQPYGSVQGRSDNPNEEPRTGPQTGPEAAQPLKQNEGHE